MSEKLTIEEIMQRYDSEWILLGDPNFGDERQVLGGTVLFHSRDRDQVYRQIAELDVKRSAIVHTGTIPEEMEFVL